MVKSQYFCDRCKVEVLNQFALYLIVISIPAGNPLRLSVCSNCIKTVSELAMANPNKQKEEK